MKEKNSELYPEAWAIFVEHARNMENEPEGKIAKYRIPHPNMSGDFIWSNHVGELFYKFKEAWHTPSLNSPSVVGKIQYIVNTF